MSHSLLCADGMQMQNVYGFIRTQVELAAYPFVQKTVHGILYCRSQAVQCSLQSRSKFLVVASGSRGPCTLNRTVSHTLQS